MRVVRFSARWERVAPAGGEVWSDERRGRRRLDLLAFWDRHGSAAATEHGGVSIRTLYRWRAAYRRRGAEGLRPISRRPHRTRKREWPKAVTEEIRRLRTEHPNLGKRKIHPLLLRFCERRRLRCPAVITIGRLIADAGGCARFRRGGTTGAGASARDARSRASPRASGRGAPGRFWRWTP